MLCFKCSLKKGECKEVCDDVLQYLKSKRNYKTTYVNKEIGLSVVSEKTVSMDCWKKGKNQSRNQFHETWMLIVQIVETKCTEKQKQIFWMYLDGLTMAEIGRRLNISGQAVKNAIFGHPKQGGGIVRKIQKHLGIN